MEGRQEEGETGVEVHKCSIQVRFSSSSSSVIIITSGSTDDCVPWPSIPFLDHVCCVCVWCWG